MKKILKSAVLPVRLAVHSGSFHADDVLCACLVRMVYGAQNVQIIRSRRREDWENSQIILDVGGKDEIKDGQVWLDHHQSGSLIRENGIRAAACGKLADLIFEDEPELLKAMRRAFLDDVEAEDNGQDCARPHFFSYIYLMNPTDAEGEALADACFMQAVTVTERILERVLANLHSEMESEEYMRQKLKTPPEDGVLVLDRHCSYVKSVLAYNLANPDRRILLCVYPSHGEWNLKCIPKGEGTYQNLIDLPEEWAGLRGRELQEQSGIPSASFCHISRFMACFKSREGAKEGAQRALERARRDL